MEIHEKIKLIRNRKGWSQEDIAHRLNIAASTYGSIERGETDVNFSRLQKIANVFEMDLLELFAVGEGVTFSLTGTNNTFNTLFNNWRVHSPSDGKDEFLQEIEKRDVLLKQHETEIEYLKQQNADLRDMIALMKKQT